MKAFLRSLVLVSLTLATSHAGNVLVTNFDETAGRQLPITTTGDAPILIGGVIQIGTFASGDPSGLIAGLNTPAGLAALLSDFISFGHSTYIGRDFSGLYASDQSVAIPADSALVGKSIYTLIGNAATLAASTGLGIVRHQASFAADNPVFEALADISDPASVVLFGSVGPGVETALGMSPASLNISNPIPEPSTSALLLLLAPILLIRQRLDATHPSGDGARHG